jgi:hypothetical protein
MQREAIRYATMTRNKMVVCERCGLIALLPDTHGWEMATTQKGLCPACLKDRDRPAPPPKPHSKTAH